MITKLTEKQEGQLKIYADKWIDVGLSTKTDRTTANRLIDEVYIAGGLKPPKTKLWFRSPFEGLTAVALNELGIEINEKNLKNPSKKVKEAMKNHINNACYGSQDASWLGFYDYFINEVDLKNLDKIKPLIELSKCCGWFWPFEDVVFLTDNPIEVHMKNEVLHRDGGPSIKYADNSCTYHLNGVKVTKEIAETPGDKLSCDLVVSEKNAQVRAEIIKKIGLPRLVKDLNAETIDSMSFEEYTQYSDSVGLTIPVDGLMYELVLLDLKDGRKREFLKMKNMSVDIIHIEGVPPGTKTVKQALAWRNGMDSFVAPVKLT